MQMTLVSTSRHYDVPGLQMWERIGDPGRIYEWHPYIEATEVLDGGKKRINRRGDGELVSERILERAERHHTFQMEQTPLPFENFVGRLSVHDEGEDACVVDWEATFTPVGIPDDEGAQLVRGFFKAGLDALARDQQTIEAR
jgi:hypothetical protein